MLRAKRRSRKTEEGTMSRLRVLICRVDDEKQPERMTELHSFDLPGVDPEQLEPETALDEMEAGVLTIGQEVMRHLLKSQWEEVDKLLVEQYQERFPPSDSDV
jgi:hypothetical protein